MSNIVWAVNRMLEGSAVESVAENAERERMGAHRVAYRLRKLTNPEPGVHSLAARYDGHYLVRITFADIGVRPVNRNIDKRVIEHSEPFVPAELLFLDDWQEVDIGSRQSAVGQKKERPPTPDLRPKPGAQSLSCRKPNAESR